MGLLILDFCVIFSMVSGLLDQLQIFWQLFLIARAFNMSGATWVVALDIFKVLTRFSKLVLFKSLSLMEFQQMFSQIKMA